jgi:hypothetical protein
LGQLNTFLARAPVTRFERPAAVPRGGRGHGR